MIRKILGALALAAFVASAPIAHAQSAPGPGPGDGFSGASAAGAASSYLTGEQAAVFSKEVERDLAAKGARLAIVFRTGRPRSELPDGISYTHGAFWVYSPIALENGETTTGYAVYNLYHGNGESLPKDKSYLHQDFPIDFVAPTAVDDVAVIIPSPEMQRRVLQIMDSPAYEALHVAPYSLVSNPLDPKYQNCNEFMLDVLAAAAWETTDMQQIKANLKAYYKPTKVKTNLLERLFGPMTDVRLKTDDQHGAIVTATYESMSAFMKDNGLLQETYIFSRPK